MIGRAAAVIVALGMVILSARALTGGDGPLTAVTAVVAAAFASNLLRRMNPVLRMMSLAVQVLALLVMAAVLIGVSSMGTSVPGSDTAAMVTAMILIVLAITEGRRAMRRG